MEKYVYTSIAAKGTIRVLDLKRTLGDELECSISQIRIADGNYQALSYEWGNSEQPFKVTIGSGNMSVLRYIPLTMNLFHALRDLRDSPDIQQKRFWIDQICINQDDDEEKGHQVALMADIYRNASRVITYLGPRGNMDEENGALELLDAVTRHFKPAIIDIALTMPSLARSNPRLVPFVIVPENSKGTEVNLENPYWTSLLLIVYSGWAHRLWMVQENVLCPQTCMLRGQRVLEWISVASIPIYFHMNMLPIAFLERLWPSLGLSGVHPVGILAAIPISWRLRLENEIGSDILQREKLGGLGRNILSFSSLGCKDPRDRIYAMLGISFDAEQLGIVPNYQQPASKVFVDMSMRIYLYYQNLKLLSNLGAVDNLSDSSLPSWSYRATPRIEARVPTSHPHPLSLNSISFEEGDTVMVVRGCIVDRIAKTTPTPPYMQISADGKEAFARNETSRQLLLSSAMVLEHLGVTIKTISSLLHAWTGDSYWPGDDLESAFYFWCKYINCANTLVLVDDTLNNEPWSSPQVLSTLKSVCKVLRDEGKEVYEDPEVVIEESAELRRISRQVDGRLYCRGRSFCVSEQNRVCNATGKVKHGDEIALLAGGEAYLLRPIGGQSRYQYVGTVWVDGLMNGEAYKDKTPEELDEEIRLV